MWLSLAGSLVVAACAAATASADVPVVSATVYPGSGTRVLALQALQECQATDETQLYVPPPSPGGNLPSGSTWTLATVLSCALQIPTSDVTNVQVQRANGSGFEDPLSNADLVDPTSYHDPQDPGAVPVIASNGPSGPNYYARPFRGGSDDNSKDSVTADGPITILVWVKSQPLAVLVKTRSVPGSTALKFSASVTSDGAAVPPSSLKWQWTFQDTGKTSTQASVVHGSTWASYFVSVQVTDPASGNAGTATTRVTTPTQPAPSNHKQSGGHKHTNSKSPTGKDNGGPNQNPGTGGSKQSGNSNQNGYSSGQSSPTSSGQQPKPQSSTSTTTTPTASTPATTTPTTTPAPPTPHRAPPKRTTSHKPAPTATGPLVTGRLIADVTPLPQSSSPLVPATASAAPTVRQATSVTTSPLTAIGAGLAVAALLGLGAWHELRGRRRSRTAH